jgi:DNA polymerase II large subunit
MGTARGEGAAAVAASVAPEAKGPAMSSVIAAYFRTISDEVERAYRVARVARGKGKDPLLDVEILPAEDLAARVEAQVGVPGVAADVRKVTRELENRELVALEIARRVARGDYGGFASREDSVDKAVRTGLSILTEGVLVAPLEGIAEVKIGRNDDGTDYVDLYFAGPIRAAGGTAQALSVLIADVVRREAGIGAYKPTEDEVERYKEEVPAYRQAANLQYKPTPEEIDLIVRNCPVCLNGEGTDQVEVAGNRDLPRVPTNQLRGGAMLVLCEGMCLKAPKILKHVDKLKLAGWEFLRRLLEKKEAREEAGKEEKE